MENREWRIENGEWRIENGEWRMEIEEDRRIGWRLGVIPLVGEF